MLTFLGFSMIVTFLTLLMTRRVSPLTALVVVPVAFGILAGQAAGLGQMIGDGIATIGPTAIMMLFTILYFGVMIDAGLFDPVIALVLRLVKGDPLKVVLGTAMLASMVSLDGDGATTYMITISAMLPVYRRLGMNPLAMTCVANIATGAMNMVPWGGPTAMVAASLKVDAQQVFVGMLPAMAAGTLAVWGVAVIIGLGERRRLGVLAFDAGAVVAAAAEPLTPAVVADPSLRRPKLFWINAALTVALMTALVMGAAPLSALFMAGAAAALLINYPNLEQQRLRIAHHAPNALIVSAVVIAAGAFAGILSGTGMVQAMSNSLLGLLPPQAGPYLAPLTALISIPGTFFLSNNAFYFGVMPIISEVASHYGISALDMAKASLVGQPVHMLSPLVASTYLLVALAKVELADHQRYSFGWALAVSLIVFAASLGLGLFPLAV